MLDVKILAAVLVSLAAFGMASDSGMNLSDPSEMLSSDFGEIGPRSLGAFIGIIDEEKNTEEVYAEFHYNSSDSQNIALSAQKVKVEGLKQVNLKEGTVNSDSPLQFLNFTGEVTASSESTISGDARNVVTSGVNLTGSYSFTEKVESQRIEIERSEAKKIKLEKVNGLIESGSTVSRLQDSQHENVMIRGFSGAIDIRPLNGTVILDGEVTELEAGTVNIS